jgi:hypothetical protein
MELPASIGANKPSAVLSYEIVGPFTMNQYYREFCFQRNESPHDGLKVSSDRVLFHGMGYFMKTIFGWVKWAVRHLEKQQ